MGNTASFELEIAELFNQRKAVPDIAQELLAQARNNTLSFEEIRTISQFVLLSGELVSLLAFFNERIKNKKRVPWDYFVEALFQSCAAVPEGFKAAIIRGAESQDALFELMNVHHLDYFDERIPSMRKARGSEAEKKAQAIKAELLAELELMKNQKIEEPQAAQLRKLEKFFPGDDQVKQLFEVHEEKKIIESLEKRPKLRENLFIPTQEPSDPVVDKALSAIEMSMEEMLQQNPEMAMDFSISHLMWENHRSALRFLEKSPETVSRAWLRAHLLLAARRYVELLDQLPEIESIDHENPEAAFEAIYFRAQAHWGLGDRLQAVELMETLLERRPEYRAGSSLLAEWKDQIL